MSLIAQATTTELTTPSVDWWGVMPLLLLTAPAMVLLHASSLLSRVFKGFYTLATVLIASVAGAFAIGLWWRVTDVERGPFSTMGGAFGVDGFSVFVTVLMCASVILAALLADGYLRREGLEGAELYVLLLLSASGGVIMASANELIVMFLGLEILSLAVYILATAHVRRFASQEAGMKYFVLGAFSSAFFLYGIALVYGATGTTSLIGIRTFLATNTLLDNALLLAGFALLLVGFGFKVAAVPFHAWTPDVYQGSPSPVVAYMASGVKAAGFAGLLRVFYLAFSTERTDWQPIVYALAVATLIAGAVLAVVQTDVKRMMAYSSISHAGFILVGVQAASQKGTEASLFYLAAYTFMVAGSFGVITAVSRAGDARTSLEDFKGLASSKPLLAAAFTVMLLAQTGVPLTSGFFAKFGVITAAVDARSYWLALVAMLSAVIGAFVYLRIIVAMYMSDGDEGHAAHAEAGDAVVLDAGAGFGVLTVPVTLWVALAVAVAVTVLVGFLPGLVTSLAHDAVPSLIPPR
ncbi:MAG: NADH-quinone oxidoreductase subunit N [Acidimicrobiales bacterium]|nr:NADH-quinone oxidoreductase subunit N [Acidimicrobiales bacterium]